MRSTTVSFLLSSFNLIIVLLATLSQGTISLFAPSLKPLLGMVLFLAVVVKI